MENLINERKGSWSKIQISNQRLIVDLEDRWEISDEETLFKNLVNPSLNKGKPYYGWARYREGYSGELVKELIKRSEINNKEHFIYDPMSGSGSTLLAAVELGFDAIGTDVSPYAVDVTNVKLYRYSEIVLKIVEKFLGDPANVVKRQKPAFKKDVKNCRSYFPVENAKSLQKIIDQIALVKNDPARNLLAAAWTMILEDCSNRKKDGNGLATRPTKIKDVSAHYKKLVTKILIDLRASPLNIKNTAYALKESAANASSIVKSFSSETKKKLGAIIFSPPYANSFDYFESYKLELLCAYYTPDELAVARNSAVRSFRKGYGYRLQTNNSNVKKICDEIEERIPAKEKKSGVTDNRSRLVPNLLIGYFEDMGRIIQELSGAMPRNSQCYIVVDQSAYLGIIVPSDLLLAELGEKSGLIVDRVIHCRTAKTSGQQITEYPYLRTALKESIIVLRKK